MDSNRSCGAPVDRDDFGLYSGAFESQEECWLDAWTRVRQSMLGLWFTSEFSAPTQWRQRSRYSWNSLYPRWDSVKALSRRVAWIIQHHTAPYSGRSTDCDPQEMTLNPVPKYVVRLQCFRKRFADLSLAGPGPNGGRFNATAMHWASGHQIAVYLSHSFHLVVP